MRFIEPDTSVRVTSVTIMYHLSDGDTHIQKHVGRFRLATEDRFKDGVHQERSVLTTEWKEVSRGGTAEQA